MRTKEEISASLRLTRASSAAVEQIDVRAVIPDSRLLYAYWADDAAPVISTIATDNAVSTGAIAAYYEAMGDLCA